MKIQTRITVLLALLVSCFAFGLWFWRLKESTESAKLLEEMRRDKGEVFSRIIELEGLPLKTLSTDYSMWDEMVEFVAAPSPEWATINIEDALPTFNANAAWVFDATMMPVYSVNNLELDSLKELPTPLTEVLPLVDSLGFPHFFIPTPKGLMEIRGAPIQPSADTGRHAAARGYFFVGKLWDDEYLQELSRTSSSSISLTAPGSGVDEVNPAGGSIAFYRVLPGADGVPLQVLQIRTNSPALAQLHRFSRQSFYWFALFVAAIFIALSLALSRWVGLPLNLILASLVRADPTLLAKIKSSRTEFGRFAVLIFDFFAQRDQLQQAEAELRESEARYRLISENMTETVWLMDMNLKMAYVSPSTLLSRGYSMEELRALPMASHFTPDSFAVVLKVIGSDLAPERVADRNLAIFGNMEVELVRKDGLIFWSDLSYKVIRDAAGKATGILIVGRDISRRKQAEEKLRDSEQRFRTLYESATDAIMLLDEKGFFDCNPATLKIFRYPSKEVFCHLHPAEFSPILQPNGLDSRIEADRHIRAAFETGSEHFDWLHQCMDGAEFMAEVSLNRIDFSGHPVLQAVVRDISERKRADEILRASEERHRTIIQTAMDGYWLADPEGRLLEVNETFCQMIGYSVPELLAMHITELVDSETSEDTAAHIQKIIKQGEDRFEARLRRKDGSLFDVEVCVQYRPGDGGRFVNFLRDITERKQAEAELIEAKEAAEAAVRAKAQFLANMSHELRTPLNGVIGMNGLLLETKLDDEQREYADLARKSADSLLGIINDILDFEKIEAGALEFELLDFNLEDALEDVTDMLGNQAAEKGLELISRIEPGVPLHLVGHPGRLRQVLINLVGNAVKFTERGEVVLSAQLDGVASDKVKVLFQVRDTGPGIPAARVEALFQPFVQADLSTTRKYGGTGLGLSISQRLVEMMGGKILLETKEGRGACFSFSLTFNQASTALGDDVPGISHGVNGIVPDGNAASRPTPAELGDLRVLVVDDSPINQKLIRIMLEKRGCTVDVAGDGIEAVQSLSRMPYDLVLMDVLMPEMDGLAATRLIRDPNSPALDHAIPIIAMTANALKGDAEVCLAAGMDDYVPKPIRSDALLAAIERQRPRIKGADGGNGSKKPSANVFDVIGLLQKIDGDLPLAFQLIEVFSSDARQQLELLQTALAAGDDTEARARAHRLKGAAGNLGAFGVEEAAAALEKGDRGVDPANAGKLLAGLEAALKTFEAVADKLVAGKVEGGVTP